ncbi:hypothetical protein ASPZODRAFT_159535 [Penicilliopsis zonata CBS 506.65]|uniref:Dol-P-Glc:Glc(2)Man(9)GlcNAc(2)-PP-Dol alpha-1,2-glucosyltransferase n=1 Tax=Penicilliopsis zonata CBS 506.65 TaxID=1073090 RepID=A0A1L9SHX4_9EURO|nr:hypothetical protein ASPZODRAFT_159535 [Penicilliopsis zonata CBS 506.65]OJJ46737.1 hypothetical protein ASPZODRAFT_159535 [Penicilliopsis zonata CBS 506.65]
MSSVQSESDVTRAARYAVPFVLLLVPLWWTQVTSKVPEPYLDEVFHVPQAQAYWAHKWTQWDPKLTTPPGLYLWSYLLCACALLLRGSPKELDAAVLRSTNTAATSVFLPWRLQTLLDALRKERNTRPAGAWLSHTVLNICLFPPIFFFSGLYYTDVLALLVVVEAYNWDLRRSSASGATPFKTMVFILFGLAALVFRQTNIFWVAVFLGGLQIVRTLHQSTKVCRTSNFTDVVNKSLENELYDPLVAEASMMDYVKASISLAIQGLKNIGAVLVSLFPYIIILAAFGIFVLWNNGVVLGHKEFHTAGIHLAQMLYIWPYIVFFSWPILAVPLLNLVVPSSFLPKVVDYGFPKQQKGMPRIATILLVTPIMLAIVHWNTIVHPFTLADNRHYVFYAFRILLNYHPAAKYAAVVVYFLCGWVALSAFGFMAASAVPRVVQVAPSVAPSPRAAQQPPTSVKDQKKDVKKKIKPTQKPTRNPASAIKASEAPRAQPFSPEVLAQIQSHIDQRRQQQQQGPTRVSFVLVWLAATALSLITAPLVEPRYFIIPWVMWRLHLPPQPVPSVYRQPSGNGKTLPAVLVSHLPLIMETLWFIAINAVTGYVFLYKGFEWPQEPGKVQRFMCAIDSLVSFKRSITPPLPRSISRPQSRSQSTYYVPTPPNIPSKSPISSPFQLTHIRGFPEESGNNVDTVRLKDILGDPMIRECWQFNYMFDLDFLMAQFDEDVQNIVQVKVVHGSWKRDSPNRIRLDEACPRYPNVEAIVAYMPEAFGTHHSKMMILLRHDDLAQIVIHTANMIPGDWANMCQAVWRSPLLPLKKDKSPFTTDLTGPIGSGARFKRDLLAYLNAYGNKKTGPLVKQLLGYDFGGVQAALIASVPLRQKTNGLDSAKQTIWGWPGLKDALQQVSSIASLGQTDKWLREIFFEALSSCAPSPSTQTTHNRPRFSIIFPTPDEIRRSLNGYGSGGSIHMKIQTATQQKQLQYMRPHLCRWAGDGRPANGAYPSVREAGRRRAAPHIKTYIRFAGKDSIDWAIVTSANLSTQAWGAAPDPKGEVRICSWEIGVLVWPDLFTDGRKLSGQRRAVMIPTFKRDLPDKDSQAFSVQQSKMGPSDSVVVGLRMPYDIPLTPYTEDDLPWCATASHTDPDWLGQTWEA